MEPVLPRRPVDDVKPRAAVSVRPIFTYLLIFDWLFGFVVWVASWLRTSIQFTADDLVVTMLLWPRRIPWTHVVGVTLLDMGDSDSDRVTHRRLDIRYRRDPATPTGPVPTVFGEYRAWARIHFLSLSLPLTFPPAADSMDSYLARTPRTWIGRHANRQRQIIRREWPARGYPLPE
jgi:hypothetical protein